MAKRVVVLGASGYAGRQICQLLAQDEDIRIVACGRREDRLKELLLSLEISNVDVSSAAFDLYDEHRLASELRQADLVVGATSRWQDGPFIARKAVECSTSYIGLYLSSPDKWKALRELRDAAVQKKVTLIDDAGTHPGLPAAMIRYLADGSQIKAAWVGAKFSLKWSVLDLAPETILDFISEMNSNDPSVYLNGQWKKGYRHSREFDFGVGAAPVACIPMCMEEIREVSRTVPGLQSTGFFIAGFGPWVDRFVFPLGMITGLLNKRLASRIVWWGLRRFESGEEYAIIRLEAETENGETIGLNVSHSDGYVMTAIPAVVAIRQLLEKAKPGLWTQAGFVEPLSFFNEIERMGLRIERNNR